MAWQFDIRPQPTMPPLAWVAAVRPGTVTVDCGTSVRKFDAGFFEGTWVGPADPARLPEATTVFGTGMVVRDGSLLAIPPTHHLECIYFAHLPGAAGNLVVSNSLAGLLTASGLELDPTVDYSSVFLGAVRACWLIDDRVGGQLRLRYQSFQIPTRTVPVTGWFVENLLIAPDLSTAVARRPREAPWTSFADYGARLEAATASIVANAPDHEPIVALSSGYDSTAVATVAAAAGVRRAVGFTTARPSARNDSELDSGVRTAATLGLAYTGFDRLGFRGWTDLADADFLASGAAGEDVVWLALEPKVSRTMLLNGYWAGTEFAMPDRNHWRDVVPITTSGFGLNEYRLRNDFFWVPLPVFGAVRTLDAPNLLDRPEMDPYRIGGRYDRPVPRRLAEEGGLQRGTFAMTKHATSVLPPRDGLDVFTPAARLAIGDFAKSEGRSATWRPRRPFSRYERALMRTAQRLHLAPLAHRLERRQASLVHWEPQLGNVLLRWAVSVVSERYKAVERTY